MENSRRKIANDLISKLSGLSPESWEETEKHDRGMILDKGYKTKFDNFEVLFFQEDDFEHIGPTDYKIEVYDVNNRGGAPFLMIRSEDYEGLYLRIEDGLRKKNQKLQEKERKSSLRNLGKVIKS